MSEMFKHKMITTTPEELFEVVGKQKALLNGL